MNAKTASEQMAGYVINVNLPDWKSPKTDTKTAEQVKADETKKRQLIVAGAILSIMIVALLFIKKK
ncbi:MAG: hypothetical protein E6Q36_09340 [Chryseobacterium sp.]|jgi:hypothetical protein|nr:MAG: hypothetical protein E6Q36_09340 [Chryseobacterium sp.]